MQSLNLAPGEKVLEIGAGKGVLTGILLEQANEVLAVEVDRQLVHVLREKCSGQSQLKIMESDILKVRLSDFVPGGEKLKIVGNLPYQITSPILEWLFGQREHWKLAVVTVQKEVALRLCAHPGSKEWSPLSIFCQVYAQPEKLFILSAGSFYPAPKVQSAVVRLLPREKPLVEESLARDFFALVHKIFTQRRKTLRRALVRKDRASQVSIERCLGELKISPDARGETLSLSQLKDLALALRGN